MNEGTYSPRDFKGGERVAIKSRSKKESWLRVIEGIVIDPNATKPIPGKKGERGLALLLQCDKWGSLERSDFEDGKEPRMYDCEVPGKRYFFYHSMVDVEHLDG